MMECFLNYIKRDGLINTEGFALQSHQFSKMRATAQRYAYVMSQGPNVGASAAFYLNGNDRRLPLYKIQSGNLDSPRLPAYLNPLPGKLIKTFSSISEGAMHWRYLLDNATV